MGIDSCFLLAQLFEWILGTVYWRQTAPKAENIWLHNETTLDYTAYMSVSGLRASGIAHTIQSHKIFIFTRFIMDELEINRKTTKEKKFITLHKYFFSLLTFTSHEFDSECYENIQKKCVSSSDLFDWITVNVYPAGIHLCP